MRGFHRRGVRFSRRQSPFNGLLWLIGLAVLFYTDNFWPGILILIGISAVLSAVWRDSEQPPSPSGEQDVPSASAPVITILPPPSPPSSTPRVDLLPSSCPRCGAPVRSNEVKWTGSHSAACSYCGSNVVAAKK